MVELLLHHSGELEGLVIHSPYAYLFLHHYKDLLHVFQLADGRKPDPQSWPHWSQLPPISPIVATRMTA